MSSQLARAANRNEGAEERATVQGVAASLPASGHGAAGNDEGLDPRRMLGGCAGLAREGSH